MELLILLSDHPWAETLFKILLSAFLGTVIGLERESHGQAAGLRTFLLVSVSSCLMMLVSLHVADLYRGPGADSTIRVDPGRIASYVLAGMGFLGAGAIITGRGSVRGLTTAAGMWLTTGIGLAVGAGCYFSAMLVTVLSYLVLYILRQSKTFIRRDKYVKLEILVRGAKKDPDLLDKEILGIVKAKIQWRSYRVGMEDKVIRYIYFLLGKEDEPWYALVESLSKMEDVVAVVLSEARVN